MQRQIISYISYHKLFLQCSQCFISALYIDISDSFVFTKAVDVGGDFEALSFQLALVGVRIGAGHIVIGMVAGNHHDRHEGYMIEAACFQFRNDVFQVRTAFNGVNEYIVHAQLMESVLDNAVVSVAGVRSAMSHDKGSIVSAHLRELGGNGFQEINYLVWFAFGALEIHERGSKGNLLEVRSLHLGDYGVIAVFHARNNVQGNNSNTGVAVCFQFGKGFFRSHLG